MLDSVSASYTAAQFGIILDDETHSPSVSFLNDEVRGVSLNGSLPLYNVHDDLCE